MRLHAAVLVAGAHDGHTERRGRHGGESGSARPGPGPGAGSSHKMAAAARRGAGPERVSGWGRRLPQGGGHGGVLGGGVRFIGRGVVFNTHSFHLNSSNTGDWG